MGAIIFDFDGTMVDSFDFVVDFLATEANMPKLTHQQKLKLRGQSMSAIGRSFGHSWPKLLWLFYKGRRQMTDHLQKLQLFDGIAELIVKLHKQNYQLYIVSSNTRRNINMFLRHRELKNSFRDIYGGVGLFGKAPALRRLLRKNNLLKSSTVYIGDELRDVEASHSIGLPVIAVSWGFSRTESLKELKPTSLVSTVAELGHAIDQLKLIQ
ncbi:MAG TPA: HAD-IA family hydrolase [Candidatus Saccharimonadales bacterium]|nr:HAD-IA family hydrolase [Candidatus Saccharimonadales bacterium]